MENAAHVCFFGLPEVRSGEEKWNLRKLLVSTVLYHGIRSKKYMASVNDQRQQQCVRLDLNIYPFVQSNTWKTSQRNQRKCFPSSPVMS